MKYNQQFKNFLSSIFRLICIGFSIVFLDSIVLAQRNNFIINTSATSFSEQVFSSLFKPEVRPAANNITVNVFASGLNAPRGLKFGSDRNIYVAEAGLGGTVSTTGQCQQVPAPVGPWLGGNTARILRFNQNGAVSTVAQNLPSTQAAIGDRMGIADIAFLDGRLYALLAGGGCSHGHPEIPNSVLRINSNGSWSPIANISSFVMNNETANPEPDDFEPDGTPYSMVAARGALYVVESNHGQLLRVETNGNISRVIDTSASQGHSVPTALTYDENFYVGNLGTFPLVAGSSKILKVKSSGKFTVVAGGLTAVLGAAFDEEDNLYVLETTTNNPFPTPGTGRVVRVRRNGTLEEIVTGLNFPTAMTFGPDGKLYISNWGFGPPIPGLGEILQVTMPRHHDDDD
ncbi:MAG: ScyD/ScyE family protein [Acidobacteriota bacterium]|nr:ScyD/ScyE family protein [Acidobacteriota bacterium]